MEYLKGNKALQNNDYLTNDIILEVKINENEIQHKMKWKAASNGNVFFEGWDFYRNNRLILDDGLKVYKVAQLFTRVFSVIFALCFIFLLALLLLFISFSDSLSMEDTTLIKNTVLFLGVFNFLNSLIYTGYSSLIREEFNNNAKGKREIFKHNIKIEFPFWLGSLCTVISFFFEKVFSSSLNFSLIVIGFTLLAFTLKFVFEYALDANKYDSKETEVLLKS